MSEVAAKRVVSGFSSLEGGQDSGTAPQIVKPNQVTFAFNTTFRGGFAHPRPGWKKLPLSFPNPTVQARFETEGRWQHAGHYEPDFGNSSLMAVVGGRFFQIDPTAKNPVQEITISASDAGITKYDMNSSKLDQGWSEQMEMFWIYNDGESKPYIFNGASARRAGPGEIKTGTVIKYARGRLWYALPNGFSFRAGDIVRSNSGTAGYQFRDAPLKETENNFLKEGGDFSVPANSGRICAMRQVAELDKSLGQGPLQVLTSNTIFSVNAPADRDTWKDVTYPIQTESLIGSGGQSQLSTQVANGDLFFRAKDGERSLVLARRQFGSWANVPQSSEVTRQLQADNPYLLRFGSAVVFDNRLLQTFSPVYTDRGVYHRGLVVLDFDLLSSLRNQSDPAWEGGWMGLNILQLVKGDFNGVERCFMFVLNLNENKIELWEQTLADHFDNVSTRIVWGFESGRFGFTSGQTQLKRLDGGHFFLDSIEGKVDFEIRYRPDSYPFWIYWLSGQKCAAMNNCALDAGGCLTLEEFQQQYEPKIGLTEPDDVCNQVVGRWYRDLFQAQIRFQFTGYAQITEAMFYATDQQMSPYGECQPAEAICQPLTGCGLSPYTYSAAA